MNFAEFFAGVGLVREGLQSHEWECVWANDISPDKRDTYVQNYNEEHFHLGDIWDIANNVSVVPDNVFLYTASFPCTDLSVAGERKGLAGAESGTLKAFLQILSEKKFAAAAPQVVMLENVKGFLTSHKGKDVAFTVDSLNKLGYVVDIIELDAVSFTPQSRPRVFLIAVEKSLAQECMQVKEKYSFGDSWWINFHKNPKLRSNKVKNIIQANPNLCWALFDVQQPENDVPDLSSIIQTDIPNGSKLWWNETRQNHLFSQMSQLHQNKLHTIVEGEMYSYGTVYRRMRKGKSMAELRTDGKAGCLRTPKGGSSKQILIRAGFGRWDVRLLTPREYARLQGVRDTFILPVNANKGYFAMGDAVCVPAIQYISEHILLPVYRQLTDYLALMDDDGGHEIA